MSDTRTSVHDAVTRHVDHGPVAGAAWLVAAGDRIEVGTAGALVDGGPPLARDAIFRISSMTKPLTAVALLRLVERGALTVHEPVDTWLPELADRRVLRDPSGPLDDTVPAHRPILVEDLLTFRGGTGFDLTTGWDTQALVGAMAGLGLGVGPPRPHVPPPPDEWMRRLGSLPLAAQPGTRWLYDVCADIAGVLVGRVAGAPFDEVLAAEVLEPSGMRDTGFSVPDRDRPRLTACYGTDPATGRRCPFDPPTGAWSEPPDFPSGGSGLVSTIDDYGRFGRMLLAGGSLDGTRVLDPSTVQALTSDRLGDDPAVGGPSADRSIGWGLGLAVQRRRIGPHRAGSYGWDGGLGTSWRNDPVAGTVGVLMTTEAFSSPAPPPIVHDFWAAVGGSAPRYPADAPQERR